MSSPPPLRLRFVLAAATVGAAVLAPTSPGRAEIINTTDANAVAAFQEGAEIESFDSAPLVGQSVSSYDGNQQCAAASQFSSRDGATFPTFHSGGASPNDPVGNPGTPICIAAPSGGIAGDVVSGANVAAPLVINTDVLWTGVDGVAFMEVIFPEEADRVGFWIPHGSVTLTLRDRTGSNLATGDVDVTGEEGSFIGIARDSADIAVAAMVAAGGATAFTIDDFTSVVPAPEPAAPLALAAGALVLGLAGRRRQAREV